jgi:hypothetical protein
MPGRARACTDSGSEPRSRLSARRPGPETETGRSLGAASDRDSVSEPEPRTWSEPESSESVTRKAAPARSAAAAAAAVAAAAGPPGRSSETH